MCEVPVRILAAALTATAIALTVNQVQAASAHKGKSVYNTYCVICHGANMVNTGARASDLRKFPLNAKGRFVHSVKKGKKEMPAWGDVLSGPQIDDLWAYVKTRGK